MIKQHGQINAQRRKKRVHSEHCVELRLTETYTEGGKGLRAEEVRS